MNRRDLSRERQLKVMITGGLGDCLLATPFLRHFRKSGAYDRIICAVPATASELFDRNPNIDQLIVCPGADLYIWGAPEKGCETFSPFSRVLTPTRVGAKMDVSPEWVIHANLNSEPVIRQLAKYHKIELEDETMELVTDENDRIWADEYTSRWRGKKTVLLNPKAQAAMKNLPRSIAQEIIDRLSDTFHLIQFAPDVGKFRSIETIPVPRIRQSAELFKRLACVVTVDSFPGHLARAVGTPAVVLFGASNPDAYGHAGNVNVRSSGCPPCADSPRLRLCTRCRCMEELPVDEIVAAVRSIARQG